MAPVNEKQQAHDLIERLAPNQISAVVHLLEVMTDPVAQSLANAPVDDEPVSEEEAREIAALTIPTSVTSARAPVEPSSPSRPRDLIFPRTAQKRGTNVYLE